MESNDKLYILIENQGDEDLYEIKTYAFSDIDEAKAAMRSLMSQYLFDVWDLVVEPTEDKLLAAFEDMDDEVGAYDDWTHVEMHGDHTKGWHIETVKLDEFDI